MHFVLVGFTFRKVFAAIQNTKIKIKRKVYCLIAYFISITIEVANERFSNYFLSYIDVGKAKPYCTNWLARNCSARTCNAGYQTAMSLLHAFLEPSDIAAATSLLTAPTVSRSTEDTFKRCCFTSLE